MNHDKIKELEAIIAELRAEIAALRAENKLLREENARLRQELYGKKSEKTDKKKGKPCEPKEDSEETKKAKTMMREARRIMRAADAAAADGDRDKKSLSGSIARESVRHRIPSGMFCRDCGGEVKDLGLAHRAGELDVNQKLFVDREHLLHRGECRCGNVSFVMPGPARGLEKTTYAPRFIAKLIVDKFRYFFPIHRQEKYFADHGIFVHRQVLNDLVLRAWQQLEPVVKRIDEINREQEVQQCDETPVCVVLENSKDYFLWCLLSPKAISFTITEKRNQMEAAKIIGPAEVVMTDGHSAYRGEVISGKHGMCLAHCRRLFYKSILSFPIQSMEVIYLFQDIYAVEKLANTDGLDADGRLALRQSMSLPLLEKLHKMVSGYNPPPRSALGKARKYLLKHWQKLTEFSRDGRLRIDNNAVEREFKDVKLGMKNFLFAQSEIGSEALAGFFTLIATLKMYRQPINQYIADVLIKIESGWPKSRIDELLPWNWTPTHNTQEATTTYREAALSIEDLIIKKKLTEKVTFHVPVQPQMGAPPA